MCKKILAGTVIMLAFGFSQTTVSNVGHGFSHAMVNRTDSRFCPRLLNYQGYLTDTLGNPINNSSLSLSFAIFDSPSGGNQKWIETQPSISVSKGIFNVLLGSVSPIPDSVFLNSTNRWLELTVAGQTLAPRTQITSVGYAYTASYSDTATYARSAAPDNDWSFRITDGADTTLQMAGRWGLARPGNVLIGIADSTHVNLGVVCTTGTASSDFKYCTVAGGFYNSATNRATVGGGQYNGARGEYSTVAGGSHNSATGWTATVGGGSYNTSSGDYATVAGGYINSAIYYGVVGGGYANSASGYDAVAGGHGNIANGGYSFVGSGYDNHASGQYAVACGGLQNFATRDYTTIAGGWANQADSANYASIGGGYFNRARGEYSTVGGGNFNTARKSYSTVAGGFSNSATEYGSAVGGGVLNKATSAHSFVGGGNSNTSSDEHAVVGGGLYNTNSGYCSAILGGYADTITSAGDYSYLFGINSNLTQDSTFMLDMPHTWFGTEANGYEFPRQRGTDGQVLGTNGSGQLSWVTGTTDTDWVISGSDMYSGVSGNVGIGTSNPDARLDVAGHIWQTGTGHSVFLGEGAGFNDDLINNYNVFVGYNAGNSNTAGAFNTAGGNGALYSNTTGYYNTAGGNYALFYNTNGAYNTAGGCYALYANTSASHNIALGERALYTQSYDNGGAVWNSFNIAVGDSALYSNQPTSNDNGVINTALGHRALRNNTTGAGNTAGGYGALYANTSGGGNTASGYYALYANTSGNYNTAVGYTSGPTSINFFNTSALGYNALPSAGSRVHIGNASVLWIGGQVAWSTYSDARAKSDIRDDVPGLAFITRLKPVSFKWDIDALNKLMGVTDNAQWDGKYDLEKNRISGFLAQDVAKAARDCGYDFSGIDSTADVYSLSYAQFVVPLVKAVQEQQTQLEIQHAEIAELRAQIKALRDRK